MKPITLILYFLVVSTFICQGQKYGLEKVDSLVAVLHQSKTDTARVNLMAIISATLYCYNNIQGLEYADKARALSEKIAYKKGSGLAFYAAGVNYIFRGDFPQAINHLTKARIILEKEADDILIGRCYTQIAGAYQFVMQHDTAIYFASKAIGLFTKINYGYGLPESYRMMGLIYQSKGVPDTAIIWFNKALTLSRKLDQQDITALVLADLGGTFIDQNNYLKSLAYSSEAIKIGEKIHGGFLAVPIGNIGYLYFQTKDYVKAKVYTLKAAEVAEQQHDVYRIAACLSFLGNLCMVEEDFPCALKNFTRSLELMKKINNASEICAGNGNMGDLYRKMRDYTNALDYLFIAKKMYEELKDEWHGNYNLYTIGDVYLQLAKYKTGEWPQHAEIPHNRQALLENAGVYLANAKSMALKSGDIDDMVLILKDISELNSLKGNTAAALEAYKESMLYSDSSNGILKSTDIARKQQEYEFSKQQDSLKIVSEQKDAITKTRFALQQKATEQERRNKRMAAIGLIIFLLVSTFMGYLFIQRRKLSNQLEASLTSLKDTQSQLIRIEKEKEGEKVRQGISRDLHDNLGSTLSGIAMYSHMVDGQLESGNYDKAKVSVGVIQKSANDIVGKLSDLVWSANPGQDSVQQLLERLHQYGMDMCKAKNMEFKMENAVADATFYLPAEHRYYIYLVGKEAINNAVKYSCASSIELKVKHNMPLLEINVIDNGIGFSIDKITRGNGLDNMEKRMEEIGARYSLYSKPGEGCTISIQLKITS